MMILRITLLGFAVLLAAVSLHSQASGHGARIIGGGQSLSSDYPWMVSLKHVSTDSHFCGASLVATNWIISAAHCYEGETLDSFVAVVGEYDLDNVSEREHEVSIKNVFLPVGDLILMELNEAVDLPILALADDTLMATLEVGDTLTVAGWGDTDASDDTAYPSVLNQVDVPLYSQEDCAAAYLDYDASDVPGYAGEIDSTMICAGASLGGVDSCQGDSGGPLLLERDGAWFQVGVVSFGEGCGLADYPGVYTRLSAYKEWLDGYIVTASEDTEDELEEEDNIVDLGSVGQNHPYLKTIPILNPNTYPVSLTGVNLTGDSGYKLITDLCSFQVLAPGEYCEVKIMARFFTAGSKTAQISVLTDDEDAPEFEVSILAKVVPEIWLDVFLPDDINWFSPEINTWYLEQGVNQAASDLENQPYTASLMTVFEGEGSLDFQWLKYGEGDLFASLEVDGVQLDTYQLGEEIIGANISLEQGVHTVRWDFVGRDRLTENEAETLLARQTVRLLSVSFSTPEPEPDVTPEPETEVTPEPEPEEETDDSGGGSTDLLLLTMLCLLFVTRRTKWSVLH
jgi:secreted trypsin-like serine protease